MKISFIIKFKNEAGYIEECVSSILKQSGNFEYEFIFVNDNTTDSSIDYVKSLQKDSPANVTVKLINLNPGEFTYASATNKGLAEVTGEYVSIVTAHAFLANTDALTKMIENFSDKAVVAVYPRSLPAEDASVMAKLSKSNANLPYKIIRSKQYFTQEADAERIGNYTFLGTFCVIKADILKDKKNWFHELPRSEDLEWSWRMIRAGYKIVYEPEAIITHHDNDTIKQVAKRWLTAVTAIILIKTNSAPSRVSLLKSSLISFMPYMLGVTLRTPGIPRKAKSLLDTAIGIYIIKKEAMLNYGSYKKWEKMYKADPI